MPAKWFPDWAGEIAAVVASGASVTQDQVDELRGRSRVIVVNNNYQLAPWADVLYAADARWWRAYPDAAKFSGLKITCDERAANDFWIQHVYVRSESDPDAHKLTLDQTGIIGHGSNGGFQAVNLALQFGARKIILLGFDFCGDHWHEKHPWPLKNPRTHTLEKWRICLDAQAAWLRTIGADVVNASPVSALTAYPKADVRTVLDRWMEVRSDAA